MPFTVLVLVAAVLAGYLRGGRLRRVADAHLRWVGLLFVGLAVQIAAGQAVAREILGDPVTVLLVTSQGLVLLWVWANRHRPGTGLIGVGVALNAAVILANGAMPVDAEALTAVGAPAGELSSSRHTLMTPGTRLPLLADRFPLPSLRTVVSAGDVVLAAGLVALTHHLMTHSPSAERRGGVRGGTRPRSSSRADDDPPPP